MQRPCLASCRALALALFTFALVSYASPALALDAGAESAAKAAFQSTEDDFLAGNYTKAIATLKKAAAGCGADKCSPATKAHVFRDLGAMYFYAKDTTSASSAFVEALKIEPSAPLNITYKTPDVEAIYDAAKTKVPAAGGGGGGGGTPAGGGGGAAGGGGGDVPTGEFGVEPAAEGLQHAPFPVYATYAGSTELAKVQAKYKGTGMTEFKPLVLVKKGDGWGGYIPCADVVQGTLQFYVQGFDANNDPVANTGSQKKPFKVKIAATLAGDPPALPGDEAPKQCKDTSDCPPDFPGCNKKADSSKLGEGEECDDDTQCASSTCLHSKCTAPEDSDSGGGGGGAGKFHRVWLGLTLALDFDILPSGNDVCKLNTKGDGPFTAGSPYACVDSSGADFPGTGPMGGALNSLIAPGKSDQVSGGSNLSNFRILLSLDVAATPNILIGARLGYVANTYPGSTLSKFPPLDFEARGTYVIGKDALKKESGISPIVFVGAGVAEFDSHVTVSVIPTPPATGSKSETAWVTSGPVFFTLGGGIRVLLSSRAALTLAGKFTGAVGNVFLPVLSPELGIQFGL